MKRHNKSNSEDEKILDMSTVLEIFRRQKTWQVIGTPDPYPEEGVSVAALLEGESAGKVDRGFSG